MLSFFCFNETAATESYPYWHTLALHDALPISSKRVRSRETPLAFLRGDVADSASLAVLATSFSASRTDRRRAMIWLASWICVAARSEEHTSELQSLMRISYAVFCLKKKKKIISR